MIHRVHWLIVAVVFLSGAMALSADPAAPGKKVRLFILSGQSNMKGVDPDASFTPAVKGAFAEDDCVVVHSAYSGQLIRTWVKDWKLPEGADPKPIRGKNGTHYEQLMEAIREAMKGKAEPASISFCWMQGEADANHKGYGAIYGAALTSLLTQLQTDLGRKDIDVVIGRISDYGNKDAENRPDWNVIRAAEQEWAEKTPRATWFDTDDLNGAENGLHYGKEGWMKLGERFAEKAIAQIKGATGKP